MSERKPVWMDEEAHGILKTYSKLVKRSMADVTTELVMQHVDTLPEDAGLDASAPAAAERAPVSESAPAAEPAAAKPAAAAKPKAKPAPAPSSTRKSSSQEKPAEEGGIRYLGGVWLV